MKARTYETMAKRELIARIRRLEDLVTHEEDLAETANDALAQRDELITRTEQFEGSRRLLEASRDRYAELFEFAPIGYALLDMNGVVQEVNPATAGLLGLERERIVDSPFLIFVAHADRRLFLDCFNRVRRFDVEQIEMTLTTRDHKLFPAHLTLRRSPSAATRSPAFHVAIVDLTRQKTIEAEHRRIQEERHQLAQQEQLARAANEAKDRFIAILSHELRTPLAPIALTIAAMERAGKVPPSLAPMLTMIRRNVELEARLIDDLLDMTRITQGKLHLKLEAIDVHAIVQDVVALCADESRAAGIAPTTELSAAHHYVLGDATRLRQVLWNLLKNAIQHTPRDGRITISSANDPAGRLNVAVSDTGAGVAPDKLDRLFEPFEQGDTESRSGSGLGLGLAICKGILDAHGGRITAASGGVGKGSTFTMDLTIINASATAASALEPAIRQSTRAKKVLLVEDDPDNANAAADLLRLSGYEVDVADSVAVALQKARGGFDVLVSDIRLPDGTGRDIVQEIGAYRPVPAIAITGYGSEQDVRRNLEAGFARHLTKPVVPDELLAAIAELVESPPGDAVSHESASHQVVSFSSRARRHR